MKALETLGTLDKLGNFEVRVTSEAPGKIEASETIEVCMKFETRWMSESGASGLFVARWEFEA